MAPALRRERHRRAIGAAHRDARRTGQEGAHAGDRHTAARRGAGQRGFGVRRHGEQQFIVVAAGQAQRQPVAAARAAAESGTEAASMTAPSPPARQRWPQVLHQPVGHIETGMRKPGHRAAQRQARLRQAVAAGEKTIRVGDLAACGAQAERAVADGAADPQPVARPRAAAAQRRTGRHMADDGQRQADRPGGGGGVAAEQDRRRIPPGRRPARRRRRQTRHPACRAAPRRSSGSRAESPPWRPGRTDWCAAACGRSGPAGRRAGNARRRPWHRR